MKDQAFDFDFLGVCEVMIEEHLYILCNRPAIARGRWEAQERGKLLCEKHLKECLLLLSTPDREVARAVLGLEEESKMVTIRELSDETEIAEPILRSRVNRARKAGQLKHVKKSGKTVLLDRNEVLPLTYEQRKRGRPKES